MVVVFNPAAPATIAFPVSQHVAMVIALAVKTLGATAIALHPARVPGKIVDMDRAYLDYVWVVV